MKSNPFILNLGILLILVGLSSRTNGQSVGLPAPRLLTTMPMGGKVGTEVEIRITGDHLDDATDLIFSDSRISAKPKTDNNGNTVANTYLVKISSDCPAGVYEARIMTRLGISSARAFSVGSLPEISEVKPNHTLESAMEIPINSITNAVVADRSIDFLRFQAKKGQRLIVDCATRGIDSKLNATVIIADEKGRDLKVERRGGALDFLVPRDGAYHIKIHELTYKGGPAYYYRLGLWELKPGEMVTRQASTNPVHAFSWPPVGLADRASMKESTATQETPKIQKITLPCDLSGSFFPAADVDIYEFEARKGEIWWVELASQRFGLSTDPSILVQKLTTPTDSNGVPTATLQDILEITDVPSPVKVSSNGYAYDGPPYNAGTSDCLGKLEIKEDGTYRIQITDLFGGTRNDPNSVYRLIIRKAQPDFALVAWAIHMELRNGDRNALSKPIALRGGATMALEVVAFRRDGFDGDIELKMEGLPEGVSAKGLKIASGQSRGIMLITAREDAPKGYANVQFTGLAEINGQKVERPCRLASMAWPIPDSWGEIPSPRLVGDVPVSVGGLDKAPMSIAAKTPVIEAKTGEKLTIPIIRNSRSEFSGEKIQLKPIGPGFEKAPALSLMLKEEVSTATLDLGALKTPPGEYLLSFIGGAVTKYRHHPEEIKLAENESEKVKQELASLQAEEASFIKQADSAVEGKKPEIEQALAKCKAKIKTASEKLKVNEEQLKKAKDMAQPKDIADIFVCEPILIRIKQAESK